MKQISVVILHIFRFEKLRDSGSLIVSFQADDSCEYWVMFPVVNRDSSNPEYGVPTLVNRTTGIEVSLTHVSAKNWLKRIEAHFIDRSELSDVSKQFETDILKTMLNLCTHQKLLEQ